MKRGWPNRRIDTVGRRAEGIADGADLAVKYSAEHGLTGTVPGSPVSPMAAVRSPVHDQHVSGRQAMSDHQRLACKPAKRRVVAAGAIGGGRAHFVQTAVARPARLWPGVLGGVVNVEAH